MFRNRDFLLLWLVAALTTLSYELFNITILVAIFQETESTLLAAGTMVARTLPAFLLGPVAGVLTDRMPRKNVLISMDILRVILIIIAILFLSGSDNVPVIGIYCVLIGLSCADVFHRPARLSIIPMLIPQEELVRANSFILASGQIVMAISYTLGGFLVLSFPLTQIAFVIMMFFVLSVVCGFLMRIRKPAKKKVEEISESVVQAFRSGLDYLRDHPIARPLTVMETIEHIPHGIWTAAIMLTFTVQALKGDAVDFGYQATGYFTGMIIGSLVALAMTSWLRRYPGRIITVNAFASGFLTFAYASSQTVWMAVALGLLFGPPFALRDVAQDSLLQGTVDEGQLGRVYATRDMLRSIMFMLSGIGFAWASDFIDIRLIYYIGGVVYLFTAVYALFNRPLQQAKMEGTPTVIS